MCSRDDDPSMTDTMIGSWYCYTCGRRCVPATAIETLDPDTALALCNCSDKNRRYSYVASTRDQARAEVVVKARLDRKTTLRALRKQHAGKALSRAETVALVEAKTKGTDNAQRD